MKRLVLLFLWGLSSNLKAQTTVATVQEALALARRSNPELVNARQNLVVQEQQKTAVRAALLPQARLYGNLDYNYALPVQLVPAEFLGGRPGEFQTLRFGLPWFLTATGEATIPVVNRPARADIAITNKNLHILDIQNLVLQDEVSTQTARVYHATLLTRAAIDITRRNLSAADTLTQIAKARLDKGQIEPLEYNRIRSVQLTTADVLYQNQLSYERNLNQLKLLLGLAPADSLILMENLANRPIEGLAGIQALTAAERPQITLRQAQVELAKMQIERERLTRWPTVSGYIRYSQQAQRNQFNFFNVDQRWFTIGVAGLQFNLPLYSGGLRNSNIARARLQLRLDEAELAYERNQQQLDNDDVRNTYNQAVQSLDLNRQNYELNAQNVQIALVKYRSGLFAYDQYLNVFNESLTAQNRFLYNLSNVFINQTILQIRNGK
ncbi:TolC family protein [Fibrisoma montanum]|uniref:TolC family protein n=1 Tax=Fibrisoma montanum TaxID=2305895 RepID=A0A418M689_9BACT|nr:TolC family protein [Fibrisoma montanum]RIV21437.1 TolC family protein [Fibrisoma montanum]